MPDAEPAGALALVLHSHMPYVEGFGTYPFGEEMLFDAFVRSHLPVLAVADRLTLTVTPVLADQLEASGVAERMARFLREHRLGAAQAEAAEAGPELEPAARDHERRYRWALERLEALGPEPLAAFRGPARSGRIALAASAATHAVLPLLATRAARRLQVDAGLRSHRRRFGEPRGFWLPECGYEPGLEELLAEHGLGWFCVNQAAHEPAEAALAPVASPGGPVAFTLDWEATRWVWSPRGYPADATYADSFRRSDRGLPLWAVGGGPYDPERARATARRQAADFVARLRDRLARYRGERGRAGLAVVAFDTELLGHWWWEGPEWLAEVLRRASEGGIELVTLDEALDRFEPEPRALRRSTWGAGLGLRTWDAPAVADLAWAARRLELRLLRALGQGMPEPAAERAARELLAVQSSDWAFLDGRGDAGDYPFERATAHARALLDAIHSPGRAAPSLRNLAPDLSLAPLTTP